MGTFVYICDHMSLNSCKNEMFTKMFVEKTKHTLFMFFNVEKFGTARQATNGDTAHAYGMLDNLGYKDTLRI
jgi:hypothetical protein